MSNPYQMPRRQYQPKVTRESIQRLTDPVAIALMIVAGISLVLGSLFLLLDVVVLVLGAAQRMQQVGQFGASPIMTLIIRILWGMILLAASGFVFYGAMEMKKLRNYQLAMGASIVAVIPCLGPCCLLGIPFGIWALVILSKPEVKQGFKS